jgi:hypothetical protein
MRTLLGGDGQIVLSYLRQMRSQGPGHLLDPDSASVTRSLPQESLTVTAFSQRISVRRQKESEEVNGEMSGQMEYRALEAPPPEMLGLEHSQVRLTNGDRSNPWLAGAWTVGRAFLSFSLPNLIKMLG